MKKNIKIISIIIISIIYVLIIFTCLLFYGDIRGWLASIANLPAEETKRAQETQIVYGFLTDPVGFPIPGAYVFVGTYEGRTDSKGGFLIDNVKPGLYPVWVYDKKHRKLKGPGISITVPVSPYRPTFLNLGGYALVP